MRDMTDIAASVGTTYRKPRLRQALGNALLYVAVAAVSLLTFFPLYIICRQLNTLDSLPSLSLIDAAFVLPVCIWILKIVFDSVPSEVMDAAVVDGCTELSVLWKIVLPLSAPGLVAVAAVSFF